MHNSVEFELSVFLNEYYMQSDMFSWLDLLHFCLKMPFKASSRILSYKLPFGRPKISDWQRRPRGGFHADN